MIRLGDKGLPVSNLQIKLKSQGFLDGPPSGIFDAETYSAVRYFQATHLGPDGKFLETDGIVGPATQWALDNPSGVSQSSGLSPKIPAGLTVKRDAVLHVAEKEHAAKVRAEPDGSNWGDGIIKYGRRPGWAWCALFTTWVWRQAGVIDFKEPGTYYLLQRATKAGWFYSLNSDDYRARIPGNALLWQHGNRTGHVSIIARVSESGDKFNTFGGNEGNRVKFGVRDMNSRDLAGFINPFGDDEQPKDFERGLVESNKVEGGATR